MPHPVRDELLFLPHAFRHNACRDRKHQHDPMKRPRTLASFVLARISEEETAALDSRGWYHGDGERPMREAARTPEAFAAFVLAHDPDRVLIECVAKRRIVKLVTGPSWSGSAEQRDSLLRLLALPYAGHPAFRDEWRADANDEQAT